MIFVFVKVYLLEENVTFTKKVIMFKVSHYKNLL